jgi:hypothetical protein
VRVASETPRTVGLARRRVGPRGTFVEFVPGQDGSITAMSPRKKIAVLVLGFVGLIVLGEAARYGFRAHTRWRTTQAAEADWARLSRCLVGDEPLGQEKPSERMRRIALGVAARKVSETPDPRDANWPKQCEPYAVALGQTWVAAREAQERDADFITMRQFGSPLAIGEALERFDVNRNTLLLAAALDHLWELASELSGTVEAMSDVPLPPPPADPIRLRSLTPVYETLNYGWRSWEFEPIASRILRMQLVSRSKPGKVCVFRSAEGPAKTPWHVRCVPISDRIPTKPPAAPRLVGLEDGAQSLVSSRLEWANAGGSGVYSAESGAKLVSADAYPGEAYGLANGAVAALDTMERDKNDEPVLEARGENIGIQTGDADEKVPKHSDTYALVRLLPEGGSSRTVLDRPSVSKTVRSVHLIGEHILWWEGTRDEDSELFAREIRWDDSAMGPVVDIGKLPASVFAGGNGLATDAATACRTKEAFFVDLAVSRGSKASTTRHAVLVHSAGRWQPPLAPEAARGQPSCQGTTLTYTWLQSGGKSANERGPLKVMQTRCTTDRCETASQTLPGWSISPDELVSLRTVAVAGIGGKVALITVGGGVFLQLAPLADLPRTPARVIADAEDLIRGPIRLDARGDAAVVLVESSHGADALHIDANGKVTPIQVDR